MHHRVQMEAAGLRKILTACESFGVSDVTKQLEILQQMLAEDEQQLQERLDQHILGSFTNLQDVYNVVLTRIKDTKAEDHLLSMMQHLLLIQEEEGSMVHYYQFLDSLVTDVVMDKKLAGAEHRFGHSVERIIAQSNEVDRLRTEANEAKTQAYALEGREGNIRKPGFTRRGGAHREFEDPIDSAGGET